MTLETFSEHPLAFLQLSTFQRPSWLWAPVFPILPVHWHSYKWHLRRVHGIGEWHIATSGIPAKQTVIG